MFKHKSVIFIGAASALIYLLVFSLPFLLSEHYRTMPPVDYAKLTDYSVIGFAEYVAGLAILFGLYLWALRLAWPGRRNSSGFAMIDARWVLLVGAAIAAILFLILSLDRH